MKTDEQVRDELMMSTKPTAFITDAATWRHGYKKGWNAARANPPRVEGFPEEECHKESVRKAKVFLDAENKKYFPSQLVQIQMESFVKGARWMHARISADLASARQAARLMEDRLRALEAERMSQPAPEERKGVAKIIETLQVAAQTAVSEEVRRELIWKAVDALRTFQAPTEPTREPLGSMEDQYLKIPAQAKQADWCACGKCHCLVCGNPMEVQPTREQVAGGSKNE